MVPEVPFEDNDAEMGESERLLRAQLRARVGSVVRGKWRIDALLGVGGMAAVYAATHRNGHRCAVKMLLPAFASNTEVVQRFLKEGYVANEVGHPGIVTVTDDDVTEDGAHFLVMELLTGESFDQFLRGHPSGLDPFEAIRVAQEVLDVLEAAHARGIVHRDVKPENVFLLRDGRVKLLDFGIARLRQGTTTAGTQVGVVMGTPSFMPPEQARGRWDEVDAQSDVWAVGAMLFVALTGRRLRSGATTNEELLQAMTVPAPPLLSVMPSVPMALADAVDRALAFDKASRWPSAKAMQTAIRAVLGEDAPTLQQPSRPPRSDPRALPDADSADATRAPLGTAIGLATSQAPPAERAIPRKARRRAPLVGGAALVLVAAGLLYLSVRPSATATSPAAPPSTDRELAASGPPEPSLAAPALPVASAPPALAASSVAAADSARAPLASPPSAASPAWATAPNHPRVAAGRAPGPSAVPTTSTAPSVSKPVPVPSFDPLGRRR
jgi:serine/threonine-protein kinase